MWNISENEFIKAYDEHADAIFRYCYFRVFDREKARDLAQDAYLRTWQYISRGKKIDNLRAFLYHVARNLIIDQSRRKKEVSLEMLQEDGFEPVGVENLGEVEDHIDGEILINRLKELDEPYREALVMRFVEGMSPGEIAVALGTSENLVSVRIHRGTKKLKELLQT